MLGGCSTASPFTSQLPCSGSTGCFVQVQQEPQGWAWSALVLTFPPAIPEAGRLPTD